MRESEDLARSNGISSSIRLEYMSGLQIQLLQIVEIDENSIPSGEDHGKGAGKQNTLSAFRYALS